MLRRLGLALALVGPIWSAPAAKDTVDFSAQIRPIISSKCFHCHGPDEGSRQAKLRLDRSEEATKERKGKFAIKPGDWQNSELMRRVTSTDPDDVMPPPKMGHPLTSTEIDLLKKWIQQGAVYTGHWAFQKPQRPALPANMKPSWAKNPIDLFIAAKLKEHHLKPSPPADRYALIRRLSLDLTGLPPTPAVVQEFANDRSSKAYEKVVDRLLASPAYGEKWTRLWLDLARYADSYGYGQDSLRRNNPWPYRDWVIQAFNDNQPFDQFTLEQIAGDLLANPTEAQRIATAFHRNTMTNVEGGTDDEEFRVAAVKDRANVTAQAWMGLTLGCAQCHTHKFDPITQKEYYQFYAFFNQTEDNDHPEETPVMPLPTQAQREKTVELKNKIAGLEKKISFSPALEKELADWEKAQQADDLWHIVEFDEIKTAQGTVLQKLDDGSYLTGPQGPEKDTWTLKTTSHLRQVTAVRLEVLPDASLPGQGPGRSSSGNFVLNNLRVSVQPSAHETKRARFVRIELPGPNRILSLAEVQVMSDGKNVARQSPASQSSTEYGGEAQRANDGNTNGDYEGEKSTTHTKEETAPWWEVDLGEEKTIDAITVWNRTDGGIGERLANFHLSAWDAHRQAVWATQVSTAPKPSVTLPLDGTVTAVMKRATATFSQAGFEIAKLADGGMEPKEGWAMAGGQGKAQTAIFEFMKPLPAGRVTFRLAQNFGKKFTLGRFRLALAETTLPAVAAPANITSHLRKAAAGRSAEEQKEVLQWFQQYAATTAAIHRQIAPLQTELEGIKPPLLPVMRELPEEKRRVTRLLSKGNFLTPAEEVSPGIPAAFHAWPQNAPQNRLGLAQWLMSAENPLTARVTANRIWAQLFGLGLVETEEDFGTQGALPTHPELLDWLAVELMQPTVKSTLHFAKADDRSEATRPWDLKRFIKLLVMSATYQQTARVTPEILAKDPRNQWLSRAPRRRLEAETIRDQALALSGLLSRKMGGPSVYPPQPDGLWRVAFDGARAYPASMGEDKYRRGIYTVWRRTIPYPSMATFDAPSRETCTFRRLPTNTPLQAYVTLNDLVYVEAAQALGRRMVREGGATVAERIRFGLALVLARVPEKTQVAELKKLYETELAHYRGNEKEALKLATNPLGDLPKDWNAAEAAAWTVVANVLLNLDGVLTKG